MKTYQEMRIECRALKRAHRKIKAERDALQKAYECLKWYQPNRFPPSLDNDWDSLKSKAEKFLLFSTLRVGDLE